jgi:type IV pilus assembly protein PilO
MTPKTPATKRERLSSPLTWHYIGLGAMILVVIGLAVTLGMDWAATDSSSNDALANRQIELKTLEIQTAPLRGLDQRVVEARKQIQDFYDTRIPAAYSAISMHIGDLATKTGVHVSRLAYNPGATTGDLTEISLDASINGEYPQIMHFVNGLERDKTFFIIRAMAFTGQQGGQVSLRLRLSTWMRPSDVPPAPTENPAAAPAVQPSQVGQ